VSYLKIHPLAVFMNIEISYRDQNHLLYQAVNMFIQVKKKVRNINMEVYEDCPVSGASLKWPFKELQFLAPQCLLNFSALEVAACA